MIKGARVTRPFTSRELPDADSGLLSTQLALFVRRTLYFGLVSCIVAGMCVASGVNLLYFLAGILLTLNAAILGFDFTVGKTSTYARNRYNLSSDQNNAASLYRHDDQDPEGSLRRALKVFPISFDSEYRYRSSLNRAALQFCLSMLPDLITHLFFSFGLFAVGYFSLNVFLQFLHQQ